jgi:putative intracellular protease/amidase
MTRPDAAPTATVHLAVFDTLADWQPGLAIAHLVGHPHRQRTPGRFRLETVGASPDAITTTAGVRILPDRTLDELDPAESALLILPGGDAWVPLYDLRAPAAAPGTDAPGHADEQGPNGTGGPDNADRPDLLAAFGRKARAFVDAGVPVAAIGGATAGLARVGLLDDRRHTADTVAFLERSAYGGAAHFQDGVRAVTDGDVVTATGTAPVEFAREIFARLEVFAPDVLDIWYRLYGMQEAGALHELMSSAPPPQPA